MNGLATVSLTAALVAGVSTPSLAATVEADEPGAATASASAASAAAAEQTIIVTGQRGEYGAKSTTTATKTKTDIRNIPQALTVISEKQIEDQAIRSVAELLTFVPGATPGTGESNRDQFTLRGNNTTADFFVDGVRDDVQYFRDFYNVDRVEVIKGPNAMIFGRGGGGGIVNRVTKRAELRRLSRGADLHRQLRRRPPDRRPRSVDRSERRASASTAFTRMATVSVATSILSATA